MVIGYSTGSLALGDFRLGLRMVAGQPTAAIELSALRDSELESLVESLDELDLSQFDYISVHAPSSFSSLTESEIVRILEPVFDRGWPVVLHPDAVSNWDLWNDFGNLVCIENMDKRKSTGRTAQELSKVFGKLPAASLCFDIAHARQIDPTMMEARRIIDEHGHRMRQIHLSDVTSDSSHQQLGFTALLGFQQVAPLLPRDIPVILETPVSAERVIDELQLAESLLTT